MKIRKKLRSLTIGLTAAAVMTAPMSVMVPTAVTAVESLTGETVLGLDSYPWQAFEQAPAKQIVTEDNGEFHVMILSAYGRDMEKWDLQLRQRELDFKAGHSYIISFKAMTKRPGIEYFTKIGNLGGDEEYFSLQGKEMRLGAHMGGNWGSVGSLDTLYKTISGTFTPVTDIEDAEWTFHYAHGKSYGGNAIDGDEMWFKDLSIYDTDTDTELVGADAEKPSVTGTTAVKTSPVTTTAVSESGKQTKPAATTSKVKTTTTKTTSASAVTTTAVSESGKQTKPAATTSKVKTTTTGATAATTVITTTAAASSVKGDSDGDGKLSVRDAADIAKMLARGKADELPDTADFNGDGKVNVRDAAAIAAALAVRSQKHSLL